MSSVENQTSHEDAANNASQGILAPLETLKASVRAIGQWMFLDDPVNARHMLKAIHFFGLGVCRRFVRKDLRHGIARVFDVAKKYKNANKTLHFILRSLPLTSEK